MNITSALEMIRKDLPLGQQEASARLVEYVLAHHQDIKHLTYSRIAQIISPNDTQTLLAVVQYCSGARLGLLDMKFELIIGEEIFEIDDSDIYEAQISGVLIHPDSGRPIENYEAFIYPFFVPGKKVGADEHY